MKKIKTLLLTTATLFSGLYMYGQAKDSSVMIEEENRNAVMINIDQPEKITSEALQQRMERSGLKNKMRDGVTIYKDVVLPEISADKVNIYTKVKKGPNNSSDVYMSVSRASDNVHTVTDSAISQNVKNFLESFVQDANFHSSMINIRNKVDQVNKDEKAHKNLLDEQRDLQKQRQRIDNRLLEIQNDLNIREVSLVKKRAGIEELRKSATTIAQ